MFRFITRRHFLINLLVAIALFLLLVIVVLWTLDMVTRHGDFKRVPSVTNTSLDKAIAALEGAGFAVEIQDSIWDASIAPLTVIRQMPEAEQMVKAKRTVYLSVNRSSAPLVEMPNFVGLSFRNAEIYLKQLGIKLGDTIRKPDIAKDAVLEQRYRELDLKPGTRIPQGSSITLVLGSGLGNEEMPVPQLLGMNYGDARAMLREMGLQIGSIIADGNVADTVQAYIYKQNPEVRQQLPDGTYLKNKMRPGQSMDIWLSVSRPVFTASDSARLGFNE